MKIILIILFFYIPGFAQLKPFVLLPINTIADTTNNYYVATTGTDTASGTYANPFSIAKADTFFNYENKDSVFFLAGTYDTTFTANNVGVVFAAYNLASKPLFYGADTVNYAHGYPWKQINTSATEYDTNSVALADTETTITSGSTNIIGYRVPITTHGYLYAYLIKIGQASAARNIKISLATRSNDTLFVKTSASDSCLINTTALTLGANGVPYLNTITYGANGRYLSEDTLWIACAISGATYITSGATGGGTSWIVDYQATAYTAFTTNTYYVCTGGINLRQLYGVGIIVSNTINITDTTKYYAVFPDTTYQIFLSGILGTEVSDASLVDTLKEWHYSNDTLYVNRYADTLAVEATVRDGIIISAGTLSGFDIRKARYGIKTSGTIDTLTLARNYLQNNYIGILDSSAGDALYHNNIINNNSINFQIVNKDTAWIWNNTFHSSGSGAASPVNILADLSKIIFQNNLTYVGVAKVGDVDDAGNILAMDYNGYQYNRGSADKFWTVGATAYDSLEQFVTATAFEDNSFDSYYKEEEPYSDFSMVWEDRTSYDFRLRNDIIVSPAIDSGMVVSLNTDFVGNPIPDALTDLHDMGAYEAVLTDNPPPAPSAVYASMVGDSVLISYDYDPLITDLDSARYFVNGTWIISKAIGSSYYHHPTQSVTSSIPEIYEMNVNTDDDSARVNFYLAPKNDTTYYRIRWKVLGEVNFTDSSAVDTLFIFIPQSTTYGVRLLDTAGQQGSLLTTNLIWVDSSFTETIITGLTFSTNYVCDITAYNDNGWVHSDSVQFTTTGSGEPYNESVYYVTPWGGVDTLLYSELDSKTFAGGDTILFLKGYTYEGYGFRIKRNSGDTARVVFGGFGTGTNPKLSMRSELPNWGIEGSWTEYDASKHIWRYTLSTGTYTSGGNVSMWLDGDYVKQSQNINTGINYPFVSSVVEWEDFTTYPQVDANYPFKVSGLYLYVYSVLNPALTYSSMEISQKTGSSLSIYFRQIDATSVNYITIDGIDFESGRDQIMLRGCSYWKIINCNFSYQAKSCVFIQTLSDVDTTNTNQGNEIYGNVFNSEFDELVNGYFGYYGGANWLSNVVGVYFRLKCVNNRVHDNTFANYGNAGVTFLGSTTHRGNFIYDNDFLNDDFMTMCRGYGIGTSSGYGGNVFVNNYINGTIGDNHSFGYNNLFAFNIIDTVRRNTPDLYNGQGEATEFVSSRYSYFVNNTIFNTNSYGAYWNGCNYMTFQNNLLVDADKSHLGLSAIKRGSSQYGSDTVKNNLFYYSGNSITDDIVSYLDTTRTIAEYNLADQEYDVISGNIQVDGTVDRADLISIADMSLPTGSVAKSAGLALSQWVKDKLLEIYPSGFYRRDGTQILQSNGTQLNTDIGAGAK